MNLNVFPDSKVHGANMGPIWGRQDPGGPHVGPMNFAIWVALMVNDLHAIGNYVEYIAIMISTLSIPNTDMYYDVYILYHLTSKCICQLLLRIKANAFGVMNFLMIVYASIASYVAC